MLMLVGIWAGLVGLLVAAGEVVIHSGALTDFDHHATRAAVSSRTPGLNAVMKAVTWLGSWVALLVTAVVIAVLVIAGRLPVLAAVVAVFAWAGEAGGVAIGKAAVGRERPPQAIWLVHAHGWSFPSGHSAVACLTFFDLGAVRGHARPGPGGGDTGLAHRGAWHRGDRVFPGRARGALDHRCDRQRRLRGQLADGDRDLARRPPPALPTRR
jgi:hypothetical protein